MGEHKGERQGLELRGVSWCTRRVVRPNDQMPVVHPQPGKERGYSTLSLVLLLCLPPPHRSGLLFPLRALPFAHFSPAASVAPGCDNHLRRGLGLLQMQIEPCNFFHFSVV